MAISSPVFRVSADGISAPAYEEILEYFKEKARTIFGSDINLDADTQDGQLLAIFSAALNDVNAQAIATYNSFNPNTAIGAALDSAVKTNGISRHPASHSTADIKLVGQAGTVIRNGIVVDTQDQKWNLPAEVVIPLSGEIIATATAQEIGAIRAPAGAISKIGTPTLGWQTATSLTAAAVGDDVESDAELRTRQTYSTMQPTIGLWDGLISSLSQIDGVQFVAGRHNDTGETSLDGIPAHSIAVVIDGGDVEEIAACIYKKKSQGVATYGAMTVGHFDDLGSLYQIKFSRSTLVPISLSVRVKASDLWYSESENTIKERLSNFVAGLGIGVSVDAAKCASIVVRDEDGFDMTFQLKEIKLNGVQDSVQIKWNQRATCTADDITVTVE